MRINIWLLLGIYTLYSALSILLFFLTSGGWSGVFYLSLGPFIYGLGFIFIFLTGLFLFLKKRKLIRINFKLILATLGIQLLALLLNKGDYGDAPGRYLFIGKMWGNSSFYNEFLQNLGALCLLVYLLLLAIFCFMVLWKGVTS